MSVTRVLYANHTGELAGAERSLFDLLAGLHGRVEVAAACPAGDLFEGLRERGVQVTSIPAATLSFRPHPVHTARGLVQLLRAGDRIRALARDFGASLIHANTERAGLAATAGGGKGRVPVVVHARAPFPENRLGSTTARMLAGRSSAIIANSRYTAEQFPTRPDRLIEVVHNPIDCTHFDPKLVDRADARASLGLQPDDVVLTVVGYLAPIKCQDDAIRILAAVRRSQPRARLLVIGGTRFTAAGARADNSAYAESLRPLASQLGIEGDVVFAGEKTDVRGALAATDLLLVPSEREGFGRVALEGMAMERPVIATSVGGTAEIVRDGVDGMLLEPRDPQRWADVATRMLADPDALEEFGRSGRRRAVDAFSSEAHVVGVLSVYSRVLRQ